MLDTHFAIWFTTSPDQLTRQERSALEQSGRKLMLSTVALWEVRMKWEASERKGMPHRIPSPYEVVSLANAYAVEIVALTIDDHLASLTVPLQHHDPFDMMLLVHAQQVGARLLTRDRKLAPHPLALVA